MFQPETEDMLPRAAPKPTSNVPIGLQDATVKPSVPELSIVFGQEPAQALQNQESKQQQKSTPQTYAEWKKQMIPKVTFAAGTGENQTTRSNVYPLRTIPITTPVPISPLTTPNGTEVIMNDNTTNAINTPKEMQFMRRSLETVTPSLAVPLTGGFPSMSSAAAATTAALQQLYATTQQRRSLESIVSQKMPATSTGMPIFVTPTRNDVLTICAGTQTEVTSPTKLQTDYATKRDIDQLFNMLQELREQQIRTSQLCEALLLQHHRKITNHFIQKEVEIQCDLLTTNPQSARNQTAIVYDYAKEATGNTLPKQKQIVKKYQVTSPAQFQTPQTMPTAQSTAYRTNTPRAPPLYQSQKENMEPKAIVLPEATSEQSLFMNELALKYLSNEKLTELLEDLKINTNGESQPLRNVENLDKPPTEMSNASYTYLKKYRLLPEDATPPRRNDAYKIAELITARAVSPQIQQSLCQQPTSPLVTQRPQNQNHLDLEHIKNQPKFL